MRLPTSFCFVVLITLAACQSNTSASITAPIETNDSVPSKADILDFATDLMDQYEVAAKPYFKALDSIWGEIDLEEGEELAYLPPMEGCRRWINEGLQSMTLLSKTYLDTCNRRTEVGMNSGETWNFGCTFFGSPAAVGIERLEFPTELHESIRFEGEGTRASFKMYVAADHYTYMTATEILVICSRIGQEWKLEDARMVAD